MNKTIIISIAVSLVFLCSNAFATQTTLFQQQAHEQVQAQPKNQTGVFGYGPIQPECQRWQGYETRTNDFAMPTQVDPSVIAPKSVASETVAPTLELVLTPTVDQKPLVEQTVDLPQETTQAKTTPTKRTKKANLQLDLRVMLDSFRGVYAQSEWPSRDETESVLPLLPLVSPREELKTQNAESRLVADAEQQEKPAVLSTEPVQELVRELVKPAAPSVSNESTADMSVTPFETQTLEGLAESFQVDEVLEPAATRSQTAEAKQSPLKGETFATPAIPESKVELTQTLERPATSLSRSVEANLNASNSSPITKVKESAALTSGVATAVKTQPAKPVVSRKTATQKKTRAAGGWWAWLPALLLPLLGWIGWKLFGGRREKAKPATSVVIAEEKLIAKQQKPVSLATGTSPTTISSTGVATEMSIVEAEVASEQVVELEPSDITMVGEHAASSCETGAVALVASSHRETQNLNDSNFVTVKQPSPSFETHTAKKIEVKKESTQAIEQRPAIAEIKRVSSTVESSKCAKTSVETASNKPASSGTGSYATTLGSEVDVTAKKSSTETKTATCLTPAGDSCDGQRGVDSSTGKHCDTFTQIKGIDRDTQQALYNAGYTRFGDLQTASAADLQRVFSGTGREFKSSDFENWSRQATLVSGEQKASTGAAQAKTKVKTQATANVSISPKASDSTNNVDDLTKIRGIGPATAKLLQKSGITSFRDLSEAGTGRLQELLSNAGSRFKMIDPSQWTEQSLYALKGDWNGLATWQAANANVSTREETDLTAKATSQSTARSNTAVGSQSSSKSGRPDDLTRIHGIGPATQRVLRANGINRFEQLAEMNSAQVESLFEEFPSRFQLLDTSTWAAQAQALVTRCADQMPGLELESGMLDEIDSISNLATTSASVSKPEVRVKTRS